MTLTELAELEGLLGHRFQDRALLEAALTHRSAASGEAARTGGNERLEFLGDRVLGLVVAEWLYGRYAREREGALAKRFVALVRRETLARVADRLLLGRHMRMARSEEDGGGRENPALLADCLEAVIAALYLDGGAAAAQAFILRYWEPLLEENVRPPQDAKTKLQEWLQGRGRPLPVYDTVGVDGPPHAPTFTVAVSVDGETPVTAAAGSKRQAAQLAAEDMLKKLIK